MATVVLQNDAEYFPKKDEFMPERWIKGDQLFDESKMHGNNPFVYLPFGFGPRSCIGRRFAEMEIFIMLTRYIRITTTKTVNTFQSILIFERVRTICHLFVLSVFQQDCKRVQR